MTLRIAFAGTPEFASEILRALLESQHQVSAVFSQPDRPAGRGRKLTSSPVKRLALDHAIPIFTPSRIDAAAVQVLRDSACDVVVVAAYGLIVPQAFLGTPRFGCLNAHASLLPRWRGAAPIQRAILAGDDHTGVCIMQMDAGLDTGDVIAKDSTPILDTDTAASLHDRLVTIACPLMISTLDQLPNVKRHAQDESLACYAHKLSKAEALIDWRDSAVVIERGIRAYNPWPIAHTTLKGIGLKIFAAQINKSYDAPPGTVVAIDDQCLTVATGDGSLDLTIVQKAGSRRMPSTEFLKAGLLALGDRLGS